MSKKYKVYITPKNGAYTYGEEIEVSAKIIQNGIKTMKKSIDAGDYDIGVYVYGDINLKVLNYNGYFGTPQDPRSIFQYSRDLSKVRIVYSDANGDSERFKGIINEEATKESFDSEEIEFRVLSIDSVIRTTKIAGGLITNGILASTAIKNMLNNTRITSLLNYSASNIDVDNDITIDDGSYFDDLSIKDGLNELLLATNSVFLIDSSDNMIVQSREESTTIYNLYGPYDLKRRQNIIEVKKYNTGKHRMFTSVICNGQESSDNGYVLDFGFRQKGITLDFITNDTTSLSIAQRLVREFQFPKVELEVNVPTYVAKDIDLLDLISFNYPLRVKRYQQDKFLPIVGGTKIGDSEMPLPLTYGNVSISPNIAYKVIEISENPSNFETILKIRQAGIGSADGYFSEEGSCFIGFAKIGSAVICAGGTVCDSYESAPIDATYIGCAVVG